MNGNEKPPESNLVERIKDKRIPWKCRLFDHKWKRGGMSQPDGLGMQTIEWFECKKDECPARVIVWEDQKQREDYGYLFGIKS